MLHVQLENTFDINKEKHTLDWSYLGTNAKCWFFVSLKGYLTLIRAIMTTIRIPQTSQNSNRLHVRLRKHVKSTFYINKEQHTPFAGLTWVQMLNVGLL
jgi:hypothetical protein